MQQYPLLQEVVKEKAAEIVDEAGEHTVRQVNDGIAELEFVYSNDQEYVEIMSFTEIVDEAFAAMQQKMMKGRR